MEKKRKHTLERAKAEHLLTPLRMRLQYARLKVEHGWQRQNLNEVENLYFHHSHQRGLNSSTLTSDKRSFAATTNNIDFPFKSLSRFQSRCLTPDTSSKNSSTAKNLTLEPVAGVMPQTTLTPFRTSYSPTGPLETQVAQQSQDPITSAQTLTTDSQVLSSVRNVGSDTEHLPAAVSILASKEPQHSKSSLSQHTLPTTTLSYMTDKNNTMPTPLISTPTTLSKMYSGPHINKLTSTTNSFSPASLTYDSFWSGIQSKFHPSLQNEPVVTPELAANETSDVTSSGHSQTTIPSLILASPAAPTLTVTSPSTPSLLPISTQSQPSSLSTTFAASTSSSPLLVSAPLTQYSVCATPTSYHNVKPLSVSCLKDLGPYPNIPENPSAAAPDVFVQ